MTESSEIGDDNVGDDWELRPWLLAGLGLLAGLAIHLIVESDGESGLGAAAVAFLFFGSLCASFVLSPKRLSESALFSLGLGLVMGGIAWLAFNATNGRADSGFTFAAGVFFSILAVPLFQANFHRKRWNTSYEETHFYCWTDAVAAGGAIAFVGLSWLVLWLLHGLFSIVGIEVIEEMIQTDGFAGAFMGATFGGAMGVLRNQINIIGTLQRVVMLVFALLAAPFAVAIVIFLVILLASGGSALWEATDSATPILLSCAVAAFILTNAIVRDSDEMRSQNAVMLASAMTLAACILPLAGFAAISMGIRIDQYGLAPERIWASIAVAIAIAYGVAYWIGLSRDRMAGWSAQLRIANLRLAAFTCVIALILALPILNFGAISASNQLARLESGTVSAEDFDYAALRWDFGDAGREALAELVESEDAEIAELAADAEAQEMRPYASFREASSERDERLENISFTFADEQIRDGITDHVRRTSYLCISQCVVLLVDEYDDIGVRVALIENARVWWVELDATGEVVDIASRVADEIASSPEQKMDSTIEIREWNGRRIYLDGEPIGEPFE